MNTESMHWQSRYLPPDPILWQGRADLPPDSCFYQRIKFLDLLTQKPEKTEAITFALVGFKCDEGVQRDLGRTGASEGPIAIRQRLAKLPLQRSDIEILDAGNIICTDHDLEASQQALAEVVAMLLEKNIIPIVLGGGHEVAWGEYQGIIKVYPKQRRLGIINFDAHFDMHSIYPSRRGSSSTVFYQVAESHKAEDRHFDYNCIGIQHAGNIRHIFEVAKQYHTKLIYADELHQGQQEKCFDFIDRVIDENDIIYMTLSLDVFSPAFAPGVGSLQPLGLSPWHVIPLIRQIATSGKVVSYDIAEHVPRYDIDHRTAKLAAMMIYEIIHHHNEHPR